MFIGSKSPESWHYHTLAARTILPQAVWPEAAKRFRHGGSYFEELDWWKKPNHANLSGDLGFMIPEMNFLKGLWEFNRKLWKRSFPFHFGLYLVIGRGALLGASALASTWHPLGVAAGTGLAVHAVYKYAGLAGAILVALGSPALFIRRLTDANLSNDTAPADLFNLLFFMTTFIFLLAGYITGGESFPGMMNLTRSLLTLNATQSVPRLLAIGVILMTALAAFIPFTHMSHFISKYFAYHAIRWDEAISFPGGKLEKKVADHLTYRPTWSAPLLRNLILLYEP